MGIDKKKLVFNPVTGKFDVTQDVSTLVETADLVANYQNLSEKGQANGYVPLDNSSKVPIAFLPNSVMQYKDQWNASTNTPTLVDGIGNAGDVYEVVVAGTQNLGSGSIVFNVGDWAVYSDVSNTWKKSINSNEVVSVNGLTGAVNLNTDNINEGSANLYYTNARFDTRLATKNTDNLVEGTSNLYYTNARAKAATVSDSIVEGVVDVAPSQNSVFDALALKADSSVVANKADTNLSNLVTTSINQNLLPDTDSTKTLGSALLRWVTGFFQLVRTEILDLRDNSGVQQGKLEYFTSTSPTGSSATTRLISVLGNLLSQTNNNSNADAVATGNILIETGNKTAGTGNSGEVLITTGTSVGGDRGKILLDAKEVDVSDSNIKNVNDPVSSKDAVNMRTLQTFDNLYQDANFETGVNIFTAYNDLSTTRPVDGVGGSSNLTSSLSSVDPLSKSSSVVLDKPALNCVGQGWSVLTTDLPKNSRAKSLKFTADYIVNSGVFNAGSDSTESDVVLYFYDVTNSKLVEPQNIKFFSNSNSLSDILESTVQFDFNCEQFRTIFHVRDSSTNSFSLKLDNLKINRQNYIYGTPQVKLPDFVPTFTGFGTVTDIFCKAYREGKFLVVNARGTAGTVTGNGATISFPYTLDSSEIITDGLHGQVVGEFSRQGLAADYALGTSNLYTNSVFVSRGAINGGLRDSNGSAIINNGEKFSFKFRVPILGWDVTSRMSDGYDGRVIAARYSLTSQTILDSVNTVIIWTNRQIDKANLVDVSNGRVYAKTSGLFKIHCSIGTGNSINIVSGNRSALYYRLNGTGPLVKIAGITHEGTVFESVQIVGSDLVELNASDYIEFVAFMDYGAASVNLSGTNNGLTYFSIEKLSGSQTISNSEVLTAAGQNLAGTLVPNTTWTALATPSIIDSTHGSLSTSGVFTPSSSGRFLVSATAVFSSNSVGTRGVRIRKNGNATGIGQIISATVSGFSAPTSSGYLNLLATDTVTFEGFQNSGGNLALDTDTGISTSFHIVKI